MDTAWVYLNQSTEPIAAELWAIIGWNDALQGIIQELLIFQYLQYGCM